MHPTPTRFLFAALCVAACGGDPDPSGPPSLVPANYKATFTEVRDCRRSGDHDFNYIKIFADPTSLDAYMTRTGNIPEGGLLLKEQYDPSDETCEGPIMQWTLMKRLPVGTDPEALDYAWQRVYDTGEVIERYKGCFECHTTCGVPPDGFDGTCALP